MNIIPFFQLIRWKNLVILTTALLVIKYGFINVFTPSFSLDHLRFFLLLLSVILVATAGYIINDIQDIGTDQINKPEKVFVGTIFTIKQSYNFYFILNITGVLIGFYLANYLGKPIFSGILIIISFLLYYYSTTLKQLPLIGNILIASLISLCILTLGFFDLIWDANPEIITFHYVLFDLLIDFSIFAFMLNLTREIIKDIEDIKGDNNQQMKTLPLYIGIKNSKIIIGILDFLLMSALIYFMIKYLQFKSFLFFYYLFAIVFPLLYFSYKLIKSKHKPDFTHLSFVLKCCMLTGIISILLISLSLKNVI